MAQKWRASAKAAKAAPKPLNREGLDSLAIAYVGRFATSRAKLIAYLARKLRERGWEDETLPPIEAVADRLVDLRYVDDEAYAVMKSGAMQRRGLGRRRIAQALQFDGIAEQSREDAAPNSAERWDAAMRHAKRKRIGPFAQEMADRPLREKQIASFMRAGHDMDLARLWTSCAPGEMPVPQDDQD